MEKGQLLIEQNLVEFLEVTASKEPVPGGGSIAAFSGATAAALVEMVANLTLGRKNYEAVQEEMSQTANKARELRLRLLAAVDEDAKAYDLVMAAYKLPKATEEEKAQRQQSIEEALKGAAKVPMQVAKWSRDIYDLTSTVIEKGNKNAVTDGKVAKLSATTGILGACYNVEINLDSIADQAFVEGMKQELSKVREDIEQK